MKYLEVIFWGIIAALGALVLEFLIMSAIGGSALGGVFQISLPASLSFAVIAAGAEETLKYLVIAKRIKMLFEKKFLILASLLAGLGFAIAETFLIYEKIGVEWQKFYPNIAGTILLHILTAGIIGYFAAAGDVKNWKTPVKALGMAFIIHLAFNLSALAF